MGKASPTTYGFTKPKLTELLKVSFSHSCAPWGDTPGKYYFISIHLSWCLQVLVKPCAKITLSPLWSFNITSRSYQKFVFFLNKRYRFRSGSVGRVPGGDLEQNEKFNGARRESRYERRRNIVKEYLIDYTSNSNLHGLKYIGEKERTFVEK